MKRHEHSLQIAVAHMLALVLDPAKTWWSALDHAAQLSPRYGAERKRRGVKRGLPDVMVLAQGKQQVALLIGIELKAPKGSLSPDQKEVRDAWIAMGHQYHVARSLEEVQDILDHCHVPMRRRMNLFSGGAHVQPALRFKTPRHKRAPRRGGPEGPLSVV
jgi:hypothetical protein